METFTEAVAVGPVVLDGGLATHLEARGHDLSGHLWSARLVRDDPGEVVAAHRDFFAAGARVATTASYQASFDGLARAGLDDREATDLLVATVDLAVRARDEFDEASDDGVTRWVAASVGPFGAALADGSEYRGDYGRSVDELVAWHRPRFEVLADTGADVLALETVPCLAEVEALLRLVDGSGRPCWLSMTVEGIRTRAGEPLAPAVEMARDVAEVVAVGINCCDPRDVPAALDVAAGAAPAMPLVAYPNSGEEWDAPGAAWTGNAAFDPAGATGWVAAGAHVVGGCCRTTPAEIAALAHAVGESAGPAD